MPPVILVHRRKTSPAYDADTIAHLARLSTYDTALADALDALIVGMKLDGLWTKIHAICVQHYAQSDSLLDLKGVQDSVNRAGSSWSTLGWTVGANYGECIDTQMVPSTSGLINVNDNHLMIYTNNAWPAVYSYWAGSGTTTTNYIGGMGDGTSSPMQYKYFGDSWQDIESPLISQDGLSGFLLGSLLSGNSAIRFGSVEATATDTSITSSDSTVSIYIGDNNSPYPGPAVGVRIAGWSAGGGLTATERANYYSRVETYMTTMGWNA